MTTTANMSLVLPTPGDTQDTWGVVLNTLLGLVDAHDHTVGKGVKVPSGGLNINANLSFGGFALTNLLGAGFTPAAPGSVTSFADLFFVNSADSNNLYFRNHTGSNIRITNGSTLDITLVGGIGGDYSSVGALEDFDDASDTYRFRQQVSTLVRQFAKITSADLKLVEYKAAGVTPVPSNGVTLKSPAALVGGYTVTFLGALPSGVSGLFVDSAGQLSVNPIFTMDINGALAQPDAAANWTSGGGGALTTVASGSQAIARIPIVLPLGSVISSYTLWIKKTTGAGIAVTSQLGEFDSTTNAFTANLTPGTGTETSSANNPGFITLTKAGLAFTVASAKSWLVTFFNSASSAGDILFHLQINYTAK